MLRINNILLGIALVVVGASTNVQAQSGRTSDTLSKVVVQIVEREIALDSAERLYSNAAYAIPREKVVEKQDYKIKDYKLELHSLDHKIKVFTVKSAPLDVLRKHYVKVGFGNYTTPYLDVFTGSGRDEKLNYALRLKHLSSKTGAIDGKSSGNSENLVDLGLKYHLSKKSDLNFNLAYERWGYNFYGIELLPEVSFVGDSLTGLSVDKQRLQFLSSSVDLVSNPFDDLEIDLGMTFNTVKDAYSAKERELGLYTKAIYKLNSSSALNIGLNTFLTKRSDSSSISRNYFSLTPSYHQHSEKFKIDAGAKVIYENDTLSGRSNVHVYPQVNIEYAFTKHISPYAGISGDMVRNTYRSLALENRFISPDVVLLNTNKAIEFYGGVKGNINSKLGFNTQLAYQNFKGLNFFVNDVLTPQAFSVVYEEGNTTVVNFLAELEYEKLEAYTFGLSMEFNSYNLSDLKASYYRPALESRVFGEYKLKKKLNLNADIFYISGLKALDIADGDVTKLKSIIDLNLGAEYLFNKKLSAFLELNNLLSRKYEHYLYLSLIHI